MKYKILWSLFLLSVILFTFALQAEERVHGAERGFLTQEALRVNPEIHAFRKKWEVAKAQAIQAGVLEDPMLGVEFEGVPTDTADLGRTSDIEWSFTQTIPFPGKLSLKKKMALEEAQKAYFEYLEKENEVLREVKSTYADLILMGETLKILLENADLLIQFENIAKSKYEVGKVSQQDLLKAQVELAKVKNQILIKEEERERAIAKMNQLLARKPDHPLGEVSSDHRFLQDFSLEDLMMIALENRSELKAMGAEIHSGEWGVRLAKRQYWPDFFSKFESRQFQGTGLEEYDVMLGVNLPWFWTRSRLEGAVKEANANLEMAHYSYESKKLEIFFEIKDALVKVNTSKNLIHLYQTSILPKSQEAVKAAQIAYQSDKIDFLMLLDGQRALLNFQIEYEEALADYDKSLAELERSVGRDFENSKFKNQNAK
ncbi:MAG: TolC family protein [Chlamydiae bacterium]|nr:TolC family protein [Chlamydiota bacterium]MBI3277011.1 TolC family protein [Chlamydiota bacterium]